MKFDEDTKLTDSLERTLIEREANALRNVAFRKMGASLLDSVRRLGRGAVAGIASMRRRAKDAKTDYVAG